MRGIRWGLAGLGLLFGCSSGAPSDLAGDASVEAGNEPVAPAAMPIVALPKQGAVLEVVKQFGAWNWSIDPQATINAGAAGFAFGKAGPGRDPTIIRQSGAWTSYGGAPLTVTVGKRADAPTRIALTASPEFWLELTDRDVRSVDGTVEGNAVVFAQAATGLDLVHLVNPRRLEEVRVLRDANAPAQLRMKVRRGPAVTSLEIVDDRIVASNADGNTIVSEPLFAIDSLGERRELTLKTTPDGNDLEVLATLDTTGLTFPVAIDPAWTAAASMITGRYEQAAVSINSTGLGGASNAIHVWGGTDASGNKLTSGEWFNFTASSPSWGGVDSTSNLTNGRHRDQAIRLPANGTFTNEGVFLTGGLSDSSTEGSLYSEPQSADRSWKAATIIARGRYALSATFLEDSSETVLVAGGWSNAAGDASTVAERWRRTAPTTIVATGSMGTKRSYHGGVRLNDGRVLVAGGSNAAGRLSTAETWSPTTNTWTATTGSMTYAHYWNPIIKLSDGRVLVPGGGGYGGGHTNTAEIFDPSTNTFSLAANMLGYRGIHSAVLLNNGRVLVAGGMSSGATYLSTAEVYDPATNTWKSAGTMSSVRSSFSLIRPWISGSQASYAFAIGGRSGSTALATVDKFTQQGLAVSCTGGGECLSGNCVNGVCCSTSTCGTGYSCNLDGTGTCKKNKGQSCSAGTECGTGICADGVCCDGACTGQCQACNITGSIGTCTAVPAGSLPVTGSTSPSRTACDSSSSSTCRGTCNGTDTAACHWPNTSTICVTQSCTDTTGLSTQTNVGYCSGASAGTCVTPSPATTPCGGYKCNGSVCGTGCVSYSQCVTGYKCDLVGGSPTINKCIPSGTKGSSCDPSSPGDCASGLTCYDGVCCTTSSCPSGQVCNDAGDPGTCHIPRGSACSSNPSACAGGSTYCVDGVCCNSTCTGQCQACDITPGTCSLVTSGQPHGSRGACAGVGACQKQCDGSSPTACGPFPTTTTTCLTESCDSSTGTYQPTSYCDGAGVCAVRATSSCSPYVCAGLSCKGSCSANTDCDANDWCSGTTCVAKKDAGAYCDASPECKSGLTCVDHACCTTSSCSGGKTCNANGLGTCSLPNGAACSAPGTDCASGKCVDGVCCNTSCTDTCAACNVTDHVGSCWPVPAGTLPVGSRTTCPGTGACQAKCDGTTTATCGAPPSTSTVCAAATCSAGKYTDTEYCDGAGNCVAKTATPCGSGAYVCSSSSTCYTTCTGTSTGCAAGYYCSGGTCVTTGALGSFCTANAQCASGTYCTNNACCTTSTCPSPKVCNANGSGTCSLPNGATCTTSTECGSGHCVDGVCCNQTCGNQCEACNVGGHEGTCYPVPFNDKPHGTRAACPGTGVCQAACDGATTTSCKAFPGSSTICTVASCSGTTATLASGCDGAGTCSAAGTVSCGRYTCSGTTCKTTCAATSDCVAGSYCEGGSCVPTKTNGKTCSLGEECSTGNCVDGVCCSSSSCGTGLKCNASTDGTCAKPLGTTCGGATECGSGKCVDGHCCDSACTGQCEACDVAGKEGTCSAVLGPVHGTTRTACLGTGDCAAQCNGSDRTKCGAAPGTSIQCAKASCSGTVYKDVAYCDGAGSCGTATSKSCAPYICEGTTACKTVCGTSADCATGYACKDGLCITTGGLGTVCTDDTQCKSGHCAATPDKSVCCTTATCPAGSVCGDTSAGTAAGTCVKVNGQTCTTGAECGSGFCIDGVCCESACGGQCEACDVPGNPGKCLGVSGDPHGSRPKCSTGGSDVCKAKQCNGASDRTQCVAFVNGAEKECTPSSCTDGTETSAGTCDGAGTCSEGKKKTCSPYACGDNKCKLSCTSDGDCAENNRCNANGKCESITAKCSDDGLSSIPLDKSPPVDCAPYRCDRSTGGCYATCNATEQCAPGKVCDGKNCVAGPEPDEGGGCGCSTPGEGNGSPWLASLAVVALATIARARRRNARA